MEEGFFDLSLLEDELEEELEEELDELELELELCELELELEELFVSVTHNNPEPLAPLLPIALLP